MIPNDLGPFFWDVNRASFGPLGHPEYVIGRVLEMGNQEAVSWMQRLFTPEEIKEVIRKDHRLTPESATFGALIYNVPTDQVAPLTNCAETMSRI